MNNQALYLSIGEIQAQYLPVGKKKLRKVMSRLSKTKRNGNRILVNRDELLEYLSNESNKQLC